MNQSDRDAVQVDGAAEWTGGGVPVKLCEDSRGGSLAPAGMARRALRQELDVEHKRNGLGFGWALSDAPVLLQIMA
jgi:hypothetical protein